MPLQTMAELYNIGISYVYNTDKEEPDENNIEKCEDTNTNTNNDHCDPVYFTFDISNIYKNKSKIKKNIFTENKLIYLCDINNSSIMKRRRNKNINNFVLKGPKHSLIMKRREQLKSS